MAHLTEVQADDVHVLRFLDLTAFSHGTSIMKARLYRQS
jgi:hypothetical protein